jgi:PmbA protein
MKKMAEKMIDESSVLKQAEIMGASDIVLTITKSLTNQIKFANNKIMTTQTWDSVDANIFFSYQKRLMSGSIDFESKQTGEKSLKKLFDNAKLLTPKEDYYGIASGNFKYKTPKDCYDKRIEKLEGKEVDFTQAAIITALANGAKRCAGVLYSSSWNVEKFTSSGVEAKDKGTSINLSIRAFADKDASGHCVSASRILSRFEPEKVAQQAAQFAKDSLRPQPGQPGQYDILFHPMIFANLLYYMSYAFSAFEVESGMSFLINKLNKKVGSSLVTIQDGAQMKNGFGSRAFDDEGVPTKTTNIIEKGKLKTYLHNTSTAKKFKTQTTANAGLVYPNCFNIVMKEGKSNVDEMISQMKNGIYITNTWYTRFSNYRTGDFSTIPRDAMFKVENGRIVGPIKELRLSDNMQHILENVVAISKEREQIEWWEVSIPVLVGHVLCKGLNITKSAK